MTVESKYAIASAALSDWLKDLAPVFHPIGSKTKINRTFKRGFPGALSKLRVIYRSSDRFVALFFSCCALGVIILA